MGNCDGSVDTDRCTTSDMAKLGDMSKLLFFQQREEPASKSLFTGKIPSFSPMFTTKIKGQVIAFPAQSYVKLPQIVDLRVEKASSEKDEPSSPKVSAAVVVPAESGSVSKLKFGIDSILSSNSSSSSEKNRSTSRDSTSTIDSLPREHSPPMSAESQRSTPSPKQDIPMQSSFRPVKSIPHQDGKLKSNPFPIRRSILETRHHPYSKSTIERSHSDPARSPDLRFTQSSERPRRRSESPRRSQALSSPTTDFHSKRYEETEFNDHSKLRIFGSTSSSAPKSSNFTPFPQSLKHLSSSSQGFPLNSSFKLSNTTKDFNEVFKDDSDLNQKLLAAKNFENILKQRSYFSGSPTSQPSSPLATSPLEKHKFGPLGFFPAMNNHHVPSFHAPSAAASNFNLQAWQSMPTNNCHPAMFRQLMNPYMYNQTAVAAAALSYFQSLKSGPSQGLMLPDGFRMCKSPPKPTFGFRPSDSDLHSEKHGNSKNKRRKWTRAVFSILQRRALEDSFKGQKYVAKPERRFLAERLGLTDAQVKIWFQNRRMKWRQEQKNKLSVGSDELSPPSGEETFRELRAQN